VADTYRDFVLDQLSPLAPRLECRRMFSGYGLYLGGAFFGILSKGRLYFKTDDGSRPEYESCGMKSFRPNPRLTLRNYFEVPVDVVEDQEQLVRWARRAARAKS
jgi:DNA transformation protein and related proteins